MKHIVLFLESIFGNAALCDNRRIRILVLQIWARLFGYCVDRKWLTD